MKPRYLLLSCMLGLSVQLAVAQSGSEAYPSKPIHLLLTVGPGGATDFMGRTFGAKLSELLGQQVVVENRPGASGTIASGAVAKSAPDGYTLLLVGVSQTINPSLMSIPHDIIKDFAPISMLTDFPLIMSVSVSVPANSVNEFVTLVKAQPGKYSFASAGNGSPPHMTGELFKLVTGTDMVHVPYSKGSGAAVVDVAAGRVPVMFDAAPSLLPHIRSGRLKVLAAASGKRNPLFPDVPTLAELGYPGIDCSLWYGMLAPAGTPPGIVKRLNAELQKILANPDVKQKLAAQGALLTGGTPEQFGAFMRAEYERWGAVVRKAGIKAG